MTPLSFTEITARLAAWKFPDHIDGVIGIATGGVVPAALVAQRLGIEMKVIAVKAGFGTQSYMNAVFQAKAGKTPGSYRRQA